jgi:hypothetical protein
VFSPSPAEGVLRQGEIVSDVTQVHLRAESLGPEAGEVDLEEKVHPYALILTQDCDLDWDFKARATHPADQGQENKRQAKLVPNILLCELTTTEVLRPRLEETYSNVSETIRMSATTACRQFPWLMIVWARVCLSWWPISNESSRSQLMNSTCVSAWA